MLPAVWGPIVWYNFHILSYSFDPIYKKKYIRFFKSVPYILPCMICTDHFKMALNNYPPDKYCVNKPKMTTWLFNMHNIVNKRLNKKIYNLSQVEKIYNDSEGNLKLSHYKMVEFLKLVRKYLMGGISSIIFFHSQNILINYSYICSCLKCRLGLITLVENFNTNKNGLLILLNHMINIIRKCGKSNTKSNIDRINLIKNRKIIRNKTNIKKIDENYSNINENQLNNDEINENYSNINENQLNNDENQLNNDEINENQLNNNKNDENQLNNDEKVVKLNRFKSNQNVITILDKNKLKIISKQTRSTPGVKATISVTPYQKYKFKIDIEKPKDVIIFFWIKNLKTLKLIKYENDDIEYNNLNTKRIDIGISIHNPKVNDIFYLKSLKMIEI